MPSTRFPRELSMLALRRRQLLAECAHLPMSAIDGRLSFPEARHTPGTSGATRERRGNLGNCKPGTLAGHVARQGQGQKNRLNAIARAGRSAGLPPRTAPHGHSTDVLSKVFSTGTPSTSLRTHLHPRSSTTQRLRHSREPSSRDGRIWCLSSDPNAREAY